MQPPTGGDVRPSGHFHPATSALDPALELPGMAGFHLVVSIYVLINWKGFQISYPMSI